MLEVFRISGKRYSPQDPSGAALSSEGRWHKRGQRVLYGSASLSTCVLELKVNGVSFHAMRNSHHFSALKVTSKAHSEVIPNTLYAKDWRNDKGWSQDFGSNWYQAAKSLVLVVKSAVLPTEVNYVINTEHPDFHQVEFSKPELIDIDPRL